MSDFDDYLEAFFNRLPPLLTREELVEKVFRGTKTVQRMQAAGWLCPIAGYGTRESYFWNDDVKAALKRLHEGERPARLPSEIITAKLD